MSDISWSISNLAQLAVLLEVSSPKPGNVNRLRRFSDTGYRHFLASASFFGRGLHLSASTGIALSEGKITPEQVGIGNLIHECAKDVFGGLNTSNTILGTVLLYVPLVVTSAAAIASDGKFSVEQSKQRLKEVLENTTVEDTINTYKAFHLVNPGGDKNRESGMWTEIHDRFDIHNPQLFQNIRNDGLTLRDLFELSAEVEPISKEWSEHFNLVFSKVYPYLNSQITSLDDIEEGIVKTFVWLLSIQPDGLITKKAGIKRSREIQKLASDIIKDGKLESETDDILSELDRILRNDGNLLNPGTTADFVSAGLLCKLLSMKFP